MFSREEALSKSLDDLKDWRLLLRCERCGGERELLLKQQWHRYGGQPALSEVLRRLRCSACGATPSAVALANTKFYRPAEQWQNIELPDGRAQLVLWNDVR